MGFWTRAWGLDAPIPAKPEPSPLLVRSEGPTIPQRPTEATLTPETALTISAVFRAVQIIVTAVSQMDLGVYRNGVEIPSPALIKQPNVNDSASAFVEETVYSLATHGNAYWRIYRSNGVISSLEVLDPSVVGIRYEKNRKVYYIGTEDFRVEDIKHLKFMRKPGQDFGVGPIQMGKAELQRALRLKNFVDNWFDTSRPPAFVLKTDQVLNAEEAQEYATRAQAFINNNGMFVLGQGLELQNVFSSPRESQYIDVQQQAVKDIARLFGIPANDLLAELSGTSMTYQNVEQANLTFLQKTLSRYMTEIENGLTDLLPRGQRVQFKESDLLRLDAKTKAEIRQIQITSGERTANEFRAEDGLEPLPEKKQPASVPAPEVTNGNP